MHIKKLEITGFKSFVDRTVIHFDHDVVGIVGPNGCGKSNIVDAIRWVLGEQSAKHLRGRAMEGRDLQRLGVARGPNGLAEVTLTFDNTNPEYAQSLPIEYRDYPEIAVTRRLYRDGTSEYLLNKTQVRLRDVTELFLGTGVGTKAYSSRRAGPNRSDRQRASGRPPHVLGGGRWRHQVQAAPQAGRTQDGADAAEPAAHQRHRFRNRSHARLAQTPGRQSRTLHRVPERAR
ncbi:MAG: AAA family ATPase [Pseudomonadota bacterium]